MRLRPTIDDLVIIDMLAAFVLLFSFLSSINSISSVPLTEQHLYLVHRRGFYLTCVLGGALINVILAPALYYFDPRYDEKIKAREAKEADTEDKSDDE